MKLYIRHPFLLSCSLLLALFFDGTGILHGCVLAILLHEAGHICTYWLFLHRLPGLRISFGGIALYWSAAELKNVVQAVILLAGPLANFLCALICLGYTTVHMTLSALLFGGINLLLGCFNLLPLGFLDGGQLFSLFLESCSTVEDTERYLRYAQTVCLVMLSVFIVLCAGWQARIALFLFLGYYCWKTFCAGN